MEQRPRPFRSPCDILTLAARGFFPPLFPFFPPFSIHLVPSFSGTLDFLSLRSPLKGCGVFVRPDKGCHSPPFSLLCGPEAGGSCRSANGILSEGLSPRALEGPRSLSLSLLKAWLITTTIAATAPSPPQARWPLEPWTAHSHNQHLAFFSPGLL